MSSPETTASENSTQRLWPILVSIISSLAIFAGTYLAYAERARLKQEGSYLPGVVGLMLFVGAMLFLTGQVVSKSRQDRWLIIAGIVAGETAAFFFIFLFLLVNTLGS